MQAVSFVEIKVLGLRYVAGAIPGKSLKRKTTESDDKREKTNWTFGPVKVELLPDQITFYWTKKN
jgi:hypothetical protein